MPSLEIIADQVQCTHGATVSDLSPDEVFYLQSRGVSAENARVMLTKVCRASLQDAVAFDPPCYVNVSLASRVSPKQKRPAVANSGPLV